MRFQQTKAVAHNPFSGKNIPSVYTDDTHAKLDGDCTSIGFIV